MLLSALIGSTVTTVLITALAVTFPKLRGLVPGSALATFCFFVAWLIFQ
jgi:hypothetical protein